MWAKALQFFNTMAQDMGTPIFSTAPASFRLKETQGAQSQKEGQEDQGGVKEGGLSLAIKGYPPFHGNLHSSH